FNTNGVVSYPHFQFTAGFSSTREIHCSFESHPWTAIPFCRRCGHVLSRLMSRAITQHANVHRCLAHAESARVVGRCIKCIVALAWNADEAVEFQCNTFISRSDTVIKVRGD